MSALLKKELRLILPGWCAAIVAAILPLFFYWNRWDITIPFFAVAVLFLALAPYGQEMSNGTFSFLLAQPEHRLRFWKVKSGLVSVALLSVWFIYNLCWFISSNAPLNEMLDPDLRGNLILSTGTVVAVAFAGGMWAPLLIRDLTTSFIIAVVAPSTILAAIMVSHFLAPQLIDDDLSMKLPFWSMAAYSVAGVWFGFRLFMRAQDVPWGSRQISLSSAMNWTSRISFGTEKRDGAWTALIRKELHLQEIAIFFTPWLILISLAAIGLSIMAPHWAADWEVRMIAWFLWLIIPLVVGCVAFAEERRLNTLESALCLPVKRRRQFAIKWVVAICLGILLGGVVPMFMGIPIPLGRNLNPFVFFAFPTVLTLVALFASALCRGMMQSLATTVCLFGAIGAITLNGNGDPRPFFSRTLWTTENLWPTLELLAMMEIAIFVTYKNYQRLQIGWRAWRDTLLWLAAASVVVNALPLAVYERPWEYVMRLEPVHGPARLSGTGRGKIADSDGPVVLLPDGRIWLGQKAPNSWKIVSGAFVNGSNWVDMAADWEKGAVSIKSDGTLWKISSPTDLKQIGSDSDWKEVEAGPMYFMALKLDGSAWVWGRGFNPTFLGNPLVGGMNAVQAGGTLAMWQRSWRTNNITEPTRLGQGVDWRHLSSIQLQPVAVADDGTMMASGVSDAVLFQFQHMFKEETNWISLVSDGMSHLGVRADGTLWGMGLISIKLIDTAASSGPLPALASVKHPIRIGGKTNWAGVSDAGDYFIALQSDGTLWTIRRFMSEFREPSRYNDWIATGSRYEITFALARDGTLCGWGNYANSSWSNVSENPFLRPTRAPLFTYNILDNK